MSRLTFFRQSGWMMMATIFTGLFMFGVHPLGSRLAPDTDYAIYGVMLGVLVCLTIPSLGLQMVFARQTAAAVTERERGQLAKTVQGVLAGTLVIWLLALFVVFLMQAAIVERWKLQEPSILWLTLLAGLCMIWKPIFSGIVQGQQNFLWFGWASILEGASRLAGVACILLLWRRDSLAMMLGLLISSALTVVLFAWQSRSVWKRPGLSYAWKDWFGNVIPLTLGFGAFQFMFGADPLFVQSWFSENETPSYIAAATLSRALVSFTGPLVWVMFPKIVRSMAIQEDTDVFWLGLVCTVGLLSLGALALSVVAPMVIQVIYGENYAEALPLLRWFPWALVPLGVANVLLNNLMARGQFSVVKWLLLVAGIYAWALTQFHGTFITVIHVLGGANLLFVLVLVWFTWRGRATASRASGSSA